MSKFPQDTPKWVIYRILNFFNEAQSAQEIVKGVQDDPSVGSDRSIGRTVAARILNKRKSLPWRRYTSPDELDDIQGLGADKYQDLIYTFGTSAAEAFRNSMYDNNVIYKENWPLHYKTRQFDNVEAIDELAYNDGLLRPLVIELVGELCDELSNDATTCKADTAMLNDAYIDSYHNSTQEADYALALWFYRFDADNWFSYDRILNECSKYFSHYTGHPWEMQLKFFKGFSHGPLLQGITPADLPVVINYPEQSVTVWTSALYD